MGGGTKAAASRRTPNVTWEVLEVINFGDVFILKELEGQDRREIPRCQWR